MAQDYQRELQVAIQAVRQAARVCREIQAEITPEALSKKDRSPVTVADFSSQALVCRELATSFPADPVIAEEDSAALVAPENEAFVGRMLQHLERQGVSASRAEACRWIDHGGSHNYAPRFWTLDPIDGTKGFLRGEQYAVSLALLIEGEIRVAALGCPNLLCDPRTLERGGSIFWAVAGQGAGVLPIDGEQTSTAIRVSPERDVKRARVCESVESGHSAHDASSLVAQRLGIQGPPVRMDSQAKYAAVARGDAEVYLRLPTRADYREKIWDHAGGVLIVQEAGGTVTDVDGRPLDFTRGSELVNNRGVIVTNGGLHAQVLKALADVGV